MRALSRISASWAYFNGFFSTVLHGYHQCRRSDFLYLSLDHLVTALIFMSVIKREDQRVGLFIDAQNLYHSAKHLYDDSRVNFANILADTVADRKLIRAMAYVISTKTGEENSFFEALGKIGIETRSKELQEFWGGAKKGDWDVGLAVDAITIAPKLDAIIIASGDGDFVPLVEYLKINMGTQVEIVAFGKSASGKLREAADDFYDLSDHPERYLIGFKEKRRRTIKSGGHRGGGATSGGTRRAVAL